MLNKSQNLQAGDQSVNIQADKIYLGLTYLDAKEIFLELFKANFPQLLESAGKIAQERADFITQKFFRELIERNPETLSKFNQPDLQSDLLIIQREYAKKW